MITLIINYLTDISTLPFTSSLCSGIILPLIYFTNPFPSTIQQELNQLSEDKTTKVYSGQHELVTYLSKGITAYEAWLDKEQELSSQAAIDQLLDDMGQQNAKNYSDFLLNKEAYRAGSEAFDRSLNIKRRFNKTISFSLASRRNTNRRLRGLRGQNKKFSRLSLFSSYHPGGKY